MARTEPGVDLPRSGAGRVAPHNLQAEESLLGAMLLARDAIAAAAEVARPDHFYKPAHGHIYDAILTLYGSGEPVDPITVGDELARAGLLDTVGGSAALIGLQANAPAISNAGRYAQIIEELALLRRMIGVAGEIAELGYSMPDDVAKAVDSAEAMVFHLAQHRQEGSMAELRQLLEQSLDRLEQLYDRGEAITGTPTGYLDLDELLAGLQPSALVVIGARPAMGKALALDTPLPTPLGWTTMGAVGVGDELLDDRGGPCTVTFTSSVQRNRECYRVSFDDGSTLVADADHQWLAYDLPAWKAKRERPEHHMAGYASDPAVGPGRAPRQGDRGKHPRVVTTRQMLDEGVTRGNGRPNWYLPLAAPVELPERPLPLDPYLLGCWLGDDDWSGESITTEDPEIVAAFEDAGYHMTPTALAGEARTYAVTDGLLTVGGCSRPADGRRSFAGQLIDLGVIGNKHVPSPYMRASAKQRLALLQGLLDTEHTVTNGAGLVELCLADQTLLSHARQLVCSLGDKPGRIREQRITQPDGRVRVAWRFAWTPFDEVFRSTRKAQPLNAARRGTAHGRPTGRSVTAIEPVPAVPVRCVTVDSPSSLYLAGESMIPTHNTSFALGMATHAALAAHRPVLFFSLEMSQLEITQRVLCSEARVDATRVRTGKLNEGDWEKIGHTVGRLAEAPIWIDDNPNVTVMEIRSKARKLKSKVGDLGLVVVDYVQLMTGRAMAESRQVEVAEISRGLKILAREIETPVVALAQLNRSLEQRADKRPMLSDLRESGCLPASTRVQRADNGEEVTLGELVLSQEQPLVWSVDGRRLVPARLTRAFPSGVKPVFRLQLASGRAVDATANHPFLTPHGWTRLDTLDRGSSVAVPRRLPPPVAGPGGWADDEVVLLAHLLGAGSLGPSVRYAAAGPANRRAVERAARRLFGIDPQPVATRSGTVALTFPAPYRSTGGRNHPLRNWLEPLGLWKAKAWTRFVPSSVAGLADEQVALFLRHLWAAGGSLTESGSSSGATISVSYPTTSRRLALDVQRLLLRLGIGSTVASAGKRRIGRSAYREDYAVRILEPARQGEFLRTVAGHEAHLEDTDVPPSDVRWDEVTSIVPLGAQPTFDATIEGTHNFIADGVVVHNSLEQDADVVLFLYRDEIYNRESPDQGIAEVIVAKHRSGPTGLVRLAFLGQYTKFVNMARS